MNEFKVNDLFEFGSDYVMFFNPQGGNDGKYTYNGDQEGTGLPVGWYEWNSLDGEPLLSNPDVPFGSMIMLYASSSNVKVTFAGEVVQGGTTLNLNFNKNWVGNACPVLKHLNDFEVENFEFGSDYVMFFNPQGGNDGKYTYNGDQEGTGLPVGWYEWNSLDGEPLLSNPEVPAATGFMVYCSSSNVKMKIPSAL